MFVATSILELKKASDRARVRNSVAVRCFALGLMLFSMLMAGCAPGRESLHELEHTLPEHWPSDLDDAASKIRERLKWLDELASSSTAEDKQILIERELIDIIGWVPEIAADTDLDEKHWSEINLAAEQLSKQLAAKASFTHSRKNMEALCELLQQKHQQLDALKTVAN